MPKAMELKNQSGNHAGWLVHCPACGYGHLFDGRWTFNGDVERPTFRASMLVLGFKDPQGKILVRRCHSFVTDGRIEFLSDCEHEMAGKTVDLPDVE